MYRPAYGHAIAFRFGGTFAEGSKILNSLTRLGCGYRLAIGVLASPESGSKDPGRQSDVNSGMRWRFYKPVTHSRSRHYWHLDSADTLVERPFQLLYFVLRKFQRVFAKRPTTKGIVVVVQSDIIFDT